MSNFEDLSLDPKCEGCKKIEAGRCIVYTEPTKQWRVRGCPFHPKTVEAVIKRAMNTPGFVDPLKASRRKAKGH